MQAVQSTGWFAELLQPHQPPCVSLYFPTHKANPSAAENHRRFRDLLSQAERELNDKFDKKQVKALMEKIDQITPEQFGAGPREGMAVFASPQHVHVIDLPGGDARARVGGIDVGQQRAGGRRGPGTRGPVAGPADPAAWGFGGGVDATVVDLPVHADVFVSARRGQARS